MGAAVHELAATLELAPRDRSLAFTVDRVEDTIPYGDFRRRFLVPERPCVIHCAETLEGDLSLQIRKGEAWDEWLPHDPQFERLQPQLLRSYLTEESISRRRNWGRVFHGAKGQVTPFHFDGNFLDIFNRQLVGEKQWTLVAPETPLPLVPGTNFARACGALNLGGVRHAQLTLRAGEILFLPRLWLHHVVTLSERSESVSWVTTRLHPPANPTPLLERAVRYTDLFLRLRRWKPGLQMPNACLFNSVHEQDNDPLIENFAPQFSFLKSVSFSIAEGMNWLREKTKTRKH